MGAPLAPLVKGVGQVAPRLQFLWMSLPLCFERSPLVERRVHVLSAGGRH